MNTVNFIYSFSWICRIYRGVSGQGGFLIFSGSVSRSLNTSESYDGVGLEIHDGNSGSFKFRTKNADGVGEFDVRTNKFFLVNL